VDLSIILTKYGKEIIVPVVEHEIEFSVFAGEGVERKYGRAGYQILWAVASISSMSLDGR
jgi:hypothetical protein